MAIINTYPTNSSVTNSDQYLTYDSDGTVTLTPAQNSIPAGACTPTSRSGGFYVGQITGTTMSTTGNKAITGVGFKPKLVRFILAPSSAASLSYSTGVATATSQSVTAVVSAGSTHGRISDTTHCMGEATLTPSWFSRGSLVSMDTDGFTINVDTAGSSPFYFEAYG